MKYIITLFFVAVFSVWGQEQDKEVTLTMSGTGQTQNEAKERALRNAIEQAFGAFISSRTEILNDEIISDQITSLSSGNIRSFEVINSFELPSGGYSITLKAILSIDKLTSFVKSKGVEVEFKGGLFAMNVKQQLLNENAEIIVTRNLIGTLHNLLQQSFDYSLDVKDPVASEEDPNSWEVPMLIEVKPNRNMDFCADLLKNTLKSISLSKEDKSNYERLKKPVYRLRILANNQIDTFYLRRVESYNCFNRLNNIWFYTHSFYIDNGLKQLRNIGLVLQHEYRGTFTPELNYVAKSRNYDPEWSNLNTLDLSFIASTENRPQVIYEYSDILKLNEIEKITKYQIFQDSIRHEFTNGGYLFKNRELDINLILSPDILISQMPSGEDCEKCNTKNFEKNHIDSIITSLNHANYMGYNDWKLVTKEALSAFLSSFMVDNFDNEIFISEKSGNGSHEWYHVKYSLLSGPQVSKEKNNDDWWEYYNELDKRSLTLQNLAYLKDREDDKEPNISLNDIFDSDSTLYKSLDTKLISHELQSFFDVSSPFENKQLLLVRKVN